MVVVPDEPDLGKILYRSGPRTSRNQAQRTTHMITGVGLGAVMVLGVTGIGLAIMSDYQESIRLVIVLVLASVSLFAGQRALAESLFAGSISSLIIRERGIEIPIPMRMDYTGFRMLKTIPFAEIRMVERGKNVWKIATGRSEIWILPPFESADEMWLEKVRQLVTDTANRSRSIESRDL